MADEQSNIENNFNYNYLLVQTILKMRDAQADIRPEPYWTYFEYALQLVVSHLDFRLKGEIQEDYAILMAAIKKIMKSSLNDQSKRTYINKLKEDFADAHRFYVMQALNRVGIVRVEDEGVINFESTDLDTFTKIVRDTHNTGAVGATNAQDGKNTPPLVKPEMVLVYAGKKLMQMPKEDYLRQQQDVTLQQKPTASSNETNDQNIAPIVMGTMPEEPDEEIEDVPNEDEVEEEEHEEEEADASKEENELAQKRKWNPSKRY